jgi:replicative DNA helicase
MRLSAPVHRLKRAARLLARRENIPLHEALDRVAAGEGRPSWSRLMQDRPSAARHFYETLRPGDLALIGARPGQGKTLMGLSILMEALEAGRSGTFFTLEYTERDVLERLRVLGFHRASSVRRLVVDTSGSISAAYIASALDEAPEGAVAMVDYLQLLDRSRGTPPLMEQVHFLAKFARERRVILIFLTQIDRSYDPEGESTPCIHDVRIADPFDLSIFSKTCFIHAGRMRFGSR